MSDRAGITRRGLFRGIGTAGLLAGCKPSERPPTTTEEHGDAAGPGAGEAALGPGPAPLAFTLNGEAKTVEVAPHVTLLAALREQLRFTGTKVVCDRGACGACTVLIDGVARNSCMTLAHDVAGAAVTTVEGLAPGGKLSVLQQAFIRHDALQCGFCTSGMLMSCQGLLERTRGQKLGREDVEAAIAGNLCRCGTYPNVVAAVLDAAGGSA
ncbi:(2Fe-2S)-binding protein [Nannocystis sp. ILAH1]|uniref:(2Fe-2S)-binding protein n=1 Tax=unclassified Nannocystis TaxID=2627009 RepID=UPI0022700D0B|nr:MULTISPECIES: (2Fe-2S)-binding protein [unclassified Nannocystis]MCY0986361.1 (2Fe-2S)-binding protein [Nannocystis sp. ILAH1]MCY1067149.1 (2Fe-2S)-binding protein [Nannocystis sp. RBIL2]